MAQHPPPIQSPVLNGPVEYDGVAQWHPFSYLISPVWAGFLSSLAEEASREAGGGVTIQIAYPD